MLFCLDAKQEAAGNRSNMFIYPEMPPELIMFLALQPQLHRSARRVQHWPAYTSQIERNERDGPTRLIARRAQVILENREQVKKDFIESVGRCLGEQHRENDCIFSSRA